MAKRIVWTDQAKADLRRIDRQSAWQILKTLARYAQTGEGNTKQLQGIEPPVIRLRAQDHRLFFHQTVVRRRKGILGHCRFDPIPRLAIGKTQKARSTQTVFKDDIPAAPGLHD
jgi:mRNA-degrading endonuclease RelE of RelBE toxin-antitoxin system